MSDDERDFFLLCDSILDDGEVSAEEAYGIAEWLNDHPEVAGSWPATELIKPLQEVWADDSVNRRELHRLARLLISVQREWAERSLEGAASVADLRFPAFTSSVVDGDPRLPSLNAKLRIPSSSELDVFYDVDLAGPSCSCPDWRARRTRLPQGHLTRCCKHVLDGYAQLSYERDVDEWLRCFIDTGWPARPGTEWRLLTVDGETVLVSSAANKGWANVFAQEDGVYLRFGYNVEERRWAYGSEPQGSSIIVDAIRSLDEARSSPSSSATGRERKIERGRPRAGRPGLNRWRIAVFLLLALLLFVFWKTRELGQRTVTSSVSSGDSWTVSTTREIRVTAPHEIVIPSGTRLRVIARAGKNLFVSYHGFQVTVPVSATDLP